MSNNHSSSDLQLIWDTYKDFESFTRETDDDLNEFFVEWKAKMDKVQSAGCQYSDLLLGLKLIDRVNLSHDSIISLISKLGSANFSSQGFLAEVVSRIKEQTDASGSPGKHKSEERNGNKHSIVKELDFDNSLSSSPATFYVDASLSNAPLKIYLSADEDTDPKSKKGSISESVFLKCPICDKNFMLNETLNQHKKNHENGMSDLVDDSSIGQDWIDSSEMDAEEQKVETVHGKIKKELTDEANNKLGKKNPSVNFSIATNISENVNGIKKPPQKRNFLPRVPCEICGKSFARCGFAQHMQTHTAKTLDYNCSQCDKAYKDNSMLKRHVSQMHATENDHTNEKKNPHRKCPCEICGKYISENCMSTHVKSHFSVAELQCELCPKKCKVLSSLKKHIKTHKQGKQSKKPIECKICLRKCKNTSIFNVHMQSHRTTRDFICSFCGKDFKTKITLDEHLNVHTKAKQFPCNICEKIFYSRNSLKFHIRAHHTGEKPYKCDFCENRFYTSTRKVAHERIHTGEKPFACHVCGKHFRDSNTRKRHVKNVHKDVKQSDT